MLSKNNKKLQAQKMEPKQQRFAIKKFTVGVASVLVGTTFALYSGAGSVSADETATQEATAEVVEDKAADQTDDKEVALTATGTADTEAGTANTDVSEATPTVEEATDQSAQTQVQATNDQNTQAEEVAKEEATPVNETNTATEEAPVTSGFRRVATTTADATPAADETATNPADQDVSDQLQNELEKNAIYSPGDPTAKQTYSGKAWVKEKGSVIDGFNANNDKPIAGVNVYLQWVNGKGYVSKVYYTTTNADGTFAIDLSKPEVSSDGTEHKFVIAGDGGFAVRTWIKNPDPDKYSVIKQGDQVYGFHTRLNRKNESWDFTVGVNKIVNSQVILQEKMLLEDWLVKPEAEWEKSPNVDGIWPDRGAFGKASGYVWFDNGDAAGTLANQWINDSNDVKATGTRVVGSYLNGDVTILLDNCKKEHKGYSVEDMKAAQAEIITAYEAEHGKGSHIAETVVATVDSNGYYYMPFRGLYGKTATDKGVKSQKINGIL